MQHDRPVLIDAKHLQAVLDYLASRPYREVYQLIAGIQTAKLHEEKPDERSTTEGGAGCDQGE